MSPKLPRLTSKELIKILKKNGWEHARTTGSHYIMVNEETRKIVSVPQHNRTMSIGTLSRILKDAGIDRANLRK